MERRRGPPTTLFPSVNGPYQLWSRGGGLLHFSLLSTGLINYGAEEGALPPTTLFPSVNGPDLLWNGGGGKQELRTSKSWEKA